MLGQLYCSWWHETSFGVSYIDRRRQNVGRAVRNRALHLGVFPQLWWPRRPKLSFALRNEKKLLRTIDPSYRLQHERTYSASYGRRKRRR